MAFYDLLTKIINKINLAVRIDKQDLSEEQKLQARENIGAGVPQIQADQNQNDETAPDYIKNRLAWTEQENKVIVEKQWVTIADASGQFTSSESLVIGDKYLVNFNGIDFELEAYGVLLPDAMSPILFPALGNAKKFGGVTDKESNEPFGILDLSAFGVDTMSIWMSQNASDSSNNSLEIIHKVEFVQQISPEYYERLGWVEGEIPGEVLFPETTLTFEKDGDGFIIYETTGKICNMIAEENYFIFLDGVMYKSKSAPIEMINGYFLAIGNCGLLGGMDTNEPFVIVYGYEQSKTAIIIEGSVGPHTLAIYKATEDIHRINPKFLPEEGFGYEEGEPNVLFDEDINWTAENSYVKQGKIGLENGKTYYVNINEQEYKATCTIMVDDGMLMHFIGNTIYLDGEDNGLPFIIAEVDGAFMVGLFNMGTSEPFPVGKYHISISSGKIHKINPKFIPDTIARVEDLQNGLDGKLEYTYEIEYGNIKLLGDNELASMAYGNGKFVAVIGDISNSAAYSEDGINWIETEMPISAELNDITYGNGKFVAVGLNGAVAYSEDGINWTEVDMSKYIVQNTIIHWRAITYGNGKFVAVGNNDMAAYSEDGINWTGITLSVDDEYWMWLTYGNGKFVAVGFNGAVAYSEDGINWTEVDMPSDIDLGNYLDIAYGNGKFVILANDSSYEKMILWSEDGISWSKQTQSPPYATMLAFGNGKFVAFLSAYSSTSTDTISCYTSIDGLSWTKINTPFPYNIKANKKIHFVHDKFIVGCKDMAMISEDGINWTIQKEVGRYYVLSQNNTDITEDIKDMLGINEIQLSQFLKNLKNIFEPKGSSEAAVETANTYTDNALAQLTELPTVTTSDNGKFLRVVAGQWSAQAILNAEEVAF